MSYRDAMMDNYNYYNDSRVRAQMFQGVWRLHTTDRHEGLVDLSESLLDSIYENERSRQMHELISAEHPVTDAYRLASLIMAWLWQQRLSWKSHETHHRGWCSSDGMWATYELRYDDVSELRGRETEKILAYIEANVQSEEEFFKSKGIEGGLIKVPVQFEVCSLCEGHGTVTNPSIDAGGISSDVFDDDPDFEDEYFAGAFDVQCPRCKGLRVEAVPEFPAWLKELVDQHHQDQWHDIDERCAELRMGA